MGEVVSLVPFCTLLVIQARTQTLNANVEAELFIGPFETPEAALDWIKIVRSILRREHKTRKTWCIENQELVRKSNRFDSAKIYAPVEIVCCHRNNLRYANILEYGPDSFILYDPGDPLVFSINFHQLVLQRVALYV